MRTGGFAIHRRKFTSYTGGNRANCPPPPAPPAMPSALRLIPHEDLEVRRLRAEVAAAEDAVLTLEEEKAALDRQLLAYNERFRRELGALMEELLNLRRRRREREFAAGRATAAERAEAEDDYRQLHEDRQQPDQLRPLTDEEQHELKKLFRAGAVLCHPDKVAPEFQAEAALRFQELKEAQMRNDLPRVRTLVAALVQGDFGARGDDTISEADVLLATLSRLQAKRASLAQEIAALRATPVCQAISGVMDWPAYFGDLRQRLELQITEETRHAGA